METLRWSIQHQSKQLMTEFNSSHGGNWLNVDAEENNAEESIKYKIRHWIRFFFFKDLTNNTTSFMRLVYNAPGTSWCTKGLLMSVAFLQVDAKLPCPPAKRSYFGLNNVILWKSNLMSFDKIPLSSLNSTFNWMEKSCLDGCLTQNLSKIRNLFYFYNILYHYVKSQQPERIPQQIMVRW